MGEVDFKAGSADTGRAEVAKIWNMTFVGVFISSVLLHTGLFMMDTLVPKYVDYLGGSKSIVGLASSLFALTALLLKFISAPAIDTFNKKRILSTMFIVIAAACFGYGIAGAIPAVLALRLLQGAGQAFIGSCSLTIAADSLPPERMGEGIAFYSLAQAICYAIAPAFALMLLDRFGYQAAFFTGAGIMVGAAIAASFIRIKHVRVNKFRLSLHSCIAMEAIIPATIILLLYISYAMITAFLVLYAATKGITAGIGYFFTIYALAMLLSRPLIGKLSDRLGFTKVFIPVMACFAVSLFIISVSSSLRDFYIAALLMALGFGSCQPAVQTLCMKCVPPEKRGAAGSMNFIGIDLGILFSGALGGAIAEQFGYAVMWRAMIVPVAIAAAVVFAFQKQIRQIETKFIKHD